MSLEKYKMSSLRDKHASQSVEPESIAKKVEKAIAKVVKNKK